MPALCSCWLTVLQWTPSSAPIWRKVHLGVQVACTLNVYGPTVISGPATSDKLGMLFTRVGEAHR